ncbi:2-oxo acid dehydrogenase subunit E2 [Ferrimonas sediminicola]|uniref:Dihydrolipoamide acetyltransferase component of pyruvate dehydrogenase complex n=1 Tax=Ferrimonas sediminicola TaxID=2569538 RepID=A0A4U1BH19_9GAMM|nr:dihydrolipoamide acetyltransferase family protein [Ferrimonas sediminicola]TKB49311.1 2-oxo acid dehydrogenase subunit E2 [Ferrimonas sediminicola]
MSSHSVDITLPSFGADMAEGQLVKWLVKEGDRVHHGDVVAVVETHKGAIDLEVFQEGRILELLHQPVVSLPVGTVLARMEADPPPQSSEESPREAVPPASTTTAVAQSPSPPPSSAGPHAAAPPTDSAATGRRILASPLARRQARVAGLDLSQVRGSGPAGAVLGRDLPRQGEPAAVPADAEAIVEPDPMRQAIAAAMSRSKREIPHYYLSHELDLEPCLTWMARINARREPEQRLLLAALLIRATALTLAAFPQLNGHLLPQGYRPSKRVNVGHAISVRHGGVVVPAITGVDTLSLDQVMEALRDQAERARGGHLRGSELECATITITSLGERGCDSVYGVIYPPQVALVGFGRIRQQPMLQQGQWHTGRRMTATLSADHRVSDGLIGARFLGALAGRLLQPEEL